MYNIDKVYANSTELAYIGGGGKDKMEFYHSCSGEGN